MVRNDLGMSSGKTASQAGHAFVGAFTNTLKNKPERIQAYHNEFPASPGTKVVLSADLAQITRLIEELQTSQVPHYVVYDSGCQNFFNGARTLTGLGIGPITRNERPKFLRRLSPAK